MCSSWLSPRADADLLPGLGEEASLCQLGGGVPVHKAERQLRADDGRALRYHRLELVEADEVPAQQGGLLIKPRSFDQVRNPSPVRGALVRRVVSE